MPMQHTPAKVIDAVRKASGTRVKVAVSDIDGILRGKYIHKDKFLSAAEGGFGFCNVVFGWDAADLCYDNARYTGWHTGYPDAQARIDLATYREVPWDNRVPFFLADFQADGGGPLSVCPRQLLRRVIDRARAAGFEAAMSLEYEWFNFRETPQSLADKAFVAPQTL